MPRNSSPTLLAQYLARSCDSDEQILNAGRGVNSVFGDAAFYFFHSRKMIFRSRLYTWWSRNKDNIRGKTTEYRRIVKNYTEKEKCFPSNPSEHEVDTSTIRLDSPTTQPTINGTQVQNITNGSEEKEQVNDKDWSSQDVLMRVKKRGCPKGSKKKKTLDSIYSEVDCKIRDTPLDFPTTQPTINGTQVQNITNCSEEMEQVNDKDWSSQDVVMPVKKRGRPKGSKKTLDSVYTKINYKIRDTPLDFPTAQSTISGTQENDKDWSSQDVLMPVKKRGRPKGSKKKTLDSVYTKINYKTRDTRFSDMPKLLPHSVLTHCEDGSDALACPLCGTFWPDEAALIIHVNSHSTSYQGKRDLQAKISQIDTAINKPKEKKLLQEKEMAKVSPIGSATNKLKGKIDLQEKQMANVGLIRSTTNKLKEETKEILSSPNISRTTITNATKVKSDLQDKRMAKISLISPATVKIKEAIQKIESSPGLTLTTMTRQGKTDLPEKKTAKISLTKPATNELNDKKELQGNKRPKIIKIPKQNLKIFFESVSTKALENHLQLAKKIQSLPDISMDCVTEEVVNDSPLHTEVTDQGDESFDDNSIEQVSKIDPSESKEFSADVNRVLQDQSTSTDINYQNNCYCSIGPVPSCKRKCSRSSPCVDGVLENCCQDPASVAFGNFVAEEISVLEDKHLFFKTKHKIQKILMEAQNEQMRCLEK